jgi:hypothetical protein
MVDFFPSYRHLFEETFEGMPVGQNYTWFVQGREGIFDAFEKTSAEAASKQVGEASTIAAHLYHVKFILELANSDARGLGVDGDWESSWKKQTVTEEEWAALKADVLQQYRSLLEVMQTPPETADREAVNGFLALLPHVAFHLGAVRTLMKAV